jgi:ribose-phosphate pyrophosphokinase
VSPDAGGIKRAEALRQRLVTTLDRPVGSAFAEKHRSGGSVTGEALVGDVSGKVALIVDDLISTGTTIARAARACRAAGAREVLAVATHGVFAPGADATLGAGAVDAVIVTDTIAPICLPAPGLATRLTRLATAPLCAEAIRRLHGDGSLSDLSGA